MKCIDFAIRICVNFAFILKTLNFVNLKNRLPKRKTRNIRPLQSNFKWSGCFLSNVFQLLTHIKELITNMYVLGDLEHDVHKYLSYSYLELKREEKDVWWEGSAKDYFCMQVQMIFFGGTLGSTLYWLFTPRLELYLKNTLMCLTFTNKFIKHLLPDF